MFVETRFFKCLICRKILHEILNINELLKFGSYNENRGVFMFYSVDTKNLHAFSEQCFHSVY